MTTTRIISLLPRASSLLILASAVTLPASAITISPGQYYTDAAGLGLGTAPSGYFRNDDAFFGQYSLGFAIDYFGTNYTSFYLNNNGNISFGNGFSEFTPSPLNTTTVAPSIAPYWADVDTRPSNGGNVYFNASVTNQIIVTWDNVGYYNQRTDKLASFQLVLRGPNYAIPGDEGNIGFFYKNVGWETGDASGGSGGFGGVPATAGFGDGQSTAKAGEVSLVGSQQNGISSVVSDQHFWFNLNTRGILGSSSDNPILPGGDPLPGWSSTLPFWSFRNVFNGAWVDPLPTDSLYYQMAGDSLFTGFRAPSTSFGNLMVEDLNGNILGSQVLPDGFVNFLTPINGFRIFGFDPLIDGENPLAFPLQLFFNTSSADFLVGPAPITQLASAVPEPSTYGMIGLVIIGAAVANRRRARRAAREGN